MVILMKVQFILDSNDSEYIFIAIF